MWKVFAMRSSDPPLLNQVVNHANMFQMNSYPAAKEAVIKNALRPRVSRLRILLLLASSVRTVPRKRK